MSAFTAPAPKAAKIPAPVALQESDAARRELYAPLVQASEEIKSDGPPPIQKQDSETPAEEPAATEEDKKAFLASILGHKPYEKAWPVYNFTVLFKDRTPEEVESLVFAVNRMAEEQNLDDAGAALLEEQAILALQLKQIRYDASRIENFDALTVTQLEERRSKLLQYPKPLYQALLAACRAFDRHVNSLTSRALDPDFWAAGTASSPSARTVPAPSTTPATGAATRTGR
jgi:hypothetical protein